MTGTATGGPHGRTTRIGALASIVLAAGSSSRFGAPKQLAHVAGRPALSGVLAAIDGLGESQILVLGAHAELIEAELPIPPGWRVTIAGDWRSGPGASLRAGLRQAPHAQAGLIALADLPWLQRAAAERVLATAAAANEDAVRAYEGESPGHPVLLRGALLARARQAPDDGMRGLLATAAVARVPCEGLGVARDLDRPL